MTEIKEPDQKGLKLKIKNAFKLLLKFLKGLKSHYINNLFSSSSSKSKGKPSKIPINLLEIYRIFWVLSWIEFALLRFPRQRYKIYLVTCESLHCLSVRREFWVKKTKTHSHTHKYTHIHKYTQIHTQHTHHHSPSSYNHHNLAKKREVGASKQDPGKENIAANTTFCNFIVH